MCLQHFLPLSHGCFGDFGLFSPPGALLRSHLHRSACALSDSSAAQYPAFISQIGTFRLNMNRFFQGLNLPDGDENLCNLSNTCSFVSHCSLTG